MKKKRIKRAKVITLTPKQARKTQDRGVIMKKKRIKRAKVITLTPKQARKTQDLGNGFTRYVFTGYTVPPNQSFVFRFVGTADNVYPVNGGWFITSDTSLPAYASASYPQNDRTWVITLWNPTTATRTAQFFFITKNPE